MTVRTKNLESTVTRMNKYEDYFTGLQNKKDLNGFRLHETPFYFKICEPIIFDQLSFDLIKGMYFPITLWKILLDSESCKGPKGGIGISYDRARRWLNNSSFIKLVQSGWIGSTPVASDCINDIIHSLLDLDHSVTFAYSKPYNDIKP
jgi:hypothetical protein